MHHHHRRDLHEEAGNVALREARRGYLPMAPEDIQRRIEWLRAAEENLKYPESPAPSIDLLTGGEHGPFKQITSGTDPETGLPCIFFAVQDRLGVLRQPRSAPPAAFLTLDLLLAFGGGLSVNDNNGGLAYLKLFGGRAKLTFGRVLVDAQPGEVAKQRTGDHRSHDPGGWSKTTAEAEEAQGRSSRSPFRGREHAIRAACERYRRNHRRSGINLSEAEYVELLRVAFRLLDALDPQPSSPTTTTPDGPDNGGRE